MAHLHYQPVCPFSRRARLILAEKKIDVSLHEIRLWEPQLAANMFDPLELAALGRNPLGDALPMLAGKEGNIYGIYAISEWAEEIRRDTPLLPEASFARAEARRLIAWFDDVFHYEVVRLILHQKITRRFLSSNQGGGAPDMAVLRVAFRNLDVHLRYMTQLLEKRDWLAGTRLSSADLAAAAHISCLDYTGDIRWSHWGIVCDWYVRLKSRPSFRPLLQEKIIGMLPPAHYAELDFYHE